MFTGTNLTEARIFIDVLSVLRSFHITSSLLIFQGMMTIRELKFCRVSLLLKVHQLGCFIGRENNPILSMVYESQQSPSIKQKKVQTLQARVNYLIENFNVQILTRFAPNRSYRRKYVTAISSNMLGSGYIQSRDQAKLCFQWIIQLVRGSE